MYAYLRFCLLLGKIRISYKWQVEDLLGWSCGALQGALVASIMLMGTVVIMLRPLLQWPSGIVLALTIVAIVQQWPHHMDMRNATDSFLHVALNEIYMQPPRRL